MTNKKPQSKSIRVSVTPGCFSAIKQFSEMRGLNMSQMMYLAFRYNFHREALDNPEVRQLFLDNGVPFDPTVVDEWRKNIEEQKTLKEIFTPLPPEALTGNENSSLIKMAGRYLFDAPKSPFDAAWRLASTLVLAACLTVGYGIVARPQLIRAVIGVEDVKQESVEHRLLRILEQQNKHA